MRLCSERPVGDVVGFDHLHTVVAPGRRHSTVGFPELLPRGGRWPDYVDTATLLVTDGEHVTRIEHFDPDDMASAVARYDELAAETPAR